MTTPPPEILFIQVERTYANGERITELLSTRFDVLDALIIVQHIASMSLHIGVDDEPAHEVKVLNVSSVADPMPDDPEYFSALQTCVPSLEMELFNFGPEAVLEWHRRWPGYEQMTRDIEAMFRKNYRKYYARRY